MSFFDLFRPCVPGGYGVPPMTVRSKVPRTPPPRPDPPTEPKRVQLPLAFGVVEMPRRIYGLPDGIMRIEMRPADFVRISVGYHQFVVRVLPGGNWVAERHEASEIAPA